MPSKAFWKGFWEGLAIYPPILRRWRQAKRDREWIERFEDKIQRMQPGLFRTLVAKEYQFPDLAIIYKDDLEHLVRQAGCRFVERPPDGAEIIT